LRKYPSTTPLPLAKLMINRAQISEGMRVLDPCAGTGTLLKLAYASGASVWAYELNEERRTQLRQDLWTQFGAGGLASDFFTNNREPVFDRVVFNPPFQADHGWDFAREAQKCLKPGGRMVCLVGEKRYPNWPGAVAFEGVDLDFSNGLPAELMVYQS